MLYNIIFYLVISVKAIFYNKIAVILKNIYYKIKNNLILSRKLTWKI